MKQTAVEFLLSHIWTTDWVNYTKEEKLKVIEQAKEIENQQMIKFAEYVATYPDKNKNVNGEMLHAKSKYDGAERTIDLLQIWFEQFKKK